MFSLILEPSTFKELVRNLQTAMHRHYVKGGHSLVPVNQMIAFADEFAPGLYDMVLGSIINNNTSEDRYALQEKRACAILHTLAYYRYSMFKTELIHVFQGLK